MDPPGSAVAQLVEVHELVAPVVVGALSEQGCQRRPVARRDPDAGGLRARGSLRGRPLAGRPLARPAETTPALGPGDCAADLRLAYPLVPVVSSRMDSSTGH